MEVPTGQMSATRASSRLVVLAVLVLAAVTPGAIAAADALPDPVSDNLLDRPIVDVAAIPVDDAPPLLLTLTAEVNDTVHVSLLRRDDVWASVDGFDISIADGGEDLDRPWLVELGDDRFAVVVPSVSTGRTLVMPVRVDGDRLVAAATGSSSVEFYAVDSTAADVDGDGRAELVLEGPPVSALGRSCVETAVRALDASTLAVVGGFELQGEIFGFGAVGEWDGRPGDDLLVTSLAAGDCSPRLGEPGRAVLSAIRLADGSLIATISEAFGTRRLDGGSLVLAADLDGDGRDEAFLQDGDTLVVLDPANGWARTAVSGKVPSPIFAGRTSADPTRGLLVWFESDGDPSPDGVGRFVLAGVRRVGTDLAVAEIGRVDLDPSDPLRSTIMESMLAVGAERQLDPAVWRGDIDGDGCPDIVAPMLLATCDGTESIREGALWLATRPIASYVVGGARELLVAASLDWQPDAGLPRDPAPSAASPGAWRPGGSGPFVLSELRAADALYFLEYPVPRPTIDGVAMGEQTIAMPGFTGDRVLVRAVAAGSRDRPSLETPPAMAFLAGEVMPGEINSISRIPVPAGQESGRDGSYVRVSLPDIRTGAVDAVDGWVLTVSQLNDWGEVAPPVIGGVTLDTTGPALSVEVPTTSAVWPWQAQLRGRSEAAVTIRIGDGEPVQADRLGRFTVTTQLAPWPQDVDVTAVDAAGNATTTRVSVVGGVDWRLFPWPAIVAVILLVGAVVGAVRTGAGTRSPRPRETAAVDDDEILAEIEDLPSGQRG